MKLPVLIAGAALNLLLVPGVAWPDQGAMRAYNQRMESLFLRLDSNGNGRLERQELDGRPALQRQLKRKAGRHFLLLEDVRTRRGTDSRSMDVQVSRVRKLVEPDPSRPRYIQTVWGYGYVFVPDGTPRSR